MNGIRGKGRGHTQNFVIMNSGLAQIFLGYTASRTKGWTDGRHDGFFESAAWGYKALWKGKVNPDSASLCRYIFSATGNDTF